MRRLNEKSDGNFLNFNRLVPRKKGAAHFEMIISFIFFMGFTLFIFIALKPYQTSTLSISVIDGLYDSFEEKASTNMSKVFLQANHTGPCFRIVLPDNMFAYAIAESHVTKLSGGNVNSNIENNDLNINNDDEFFRVTISPEFEDGTLSGCAVISDYEIGSIVERKVISYSALEEMVDDYENDYENLRAKLGVYTIFDFAIVAENLPIKMEPISGIPDEVDVIAQNYMLEVLRSDGNLTNERFTLKLW